MSSYWIGKAKKILKRTQILFLNQKEVSLLTGMSWEDGSLIPGGFRYSNGSGDQWDGRGQIIH